MVRFDSLSAWISVDDVPLAEFGEEMSQADRKVTCWIPSEAGKVRIPPIHPSSFRSNFWQDIPYNWKHEDLSGIGCTGGWAFVDGKYVSGRLLDLSLISKTVCITGVATSAITEQPIMFTSLELTDNDEFLHNAASSELGEIKVDLWVVRKLDPVPFQTTNFDEAGKLHERSKKAISHCAKTGDEVSVPRPMSFRNAVKLNHLVTFIFRYRPLGILQANDIAPAPEPTPATHKRAAPPDDVIDISDDSDQEDSSSRIAKLEEELLQLRKRDAKRVRPEKRVKREVKLEPNITSGEVIDLTFSILRRHQLSHISLDDANYTEKPENHGDDTTSDT
ncbi:hypothetical protein IW261DRAFT_1470504 [Armillaria novae-zelandiae]|uniref:DUF7918 domain-containing protein n=1 Tax=Armillaria novae-zelandiae TaxID=153914 RepID=A0AA39PCA3_9AGAR|nr:hypothetical protein IW261DRAFT_1470504 [Armillaria novae-zelandiae]